MNPQPSIDVTQPVMGVLARIQTRRGTDAAVQLAFARLRELDRVLSDYLPESELNRATQEAAHRPVRLSRDLLNVLEYSQRLAEETSGAFDVTAGPLIRLWRQARREQRLPSPEALAEARDRSGYRKMTLRSGALSVAVAGMQLDLGGIAKGYAADQAIRVLRTHGASESLVALAGDIVAGAGNWRVALEHRGRVRETLTLSQAAVSTSGDSEQFLEVEGVRYSHIVDPRTGLGLTGAPTVSVIAPSGMEADGLATAICVAGTRIAGRRRIRVWITPGA